MPPIHRGPTWLTCAVTIFIIIVGGIFPLASVASENAAVRILKMDAKVKPVTPQMFKILEDVIRDACGRIQRLSRPTPETWDPAFAEASLKCIDDALISHGFLYPDVGFVDQLADTLTPYTMIASRRESFERQHHNARRISMIAQRFPGPFYIADCDTACFIYLGVADRLHLPIHFIDLPGFDNYPGHNIVRWREGDQFIDWETMDGCVKPDDYYKSTWGITDAELQAGSALTDLTLDQALGYEHSLIAIQYERRGEHEKALTELELSLRMYPQNMLACNNYAWDTAVGPKVDKRNHPKAILRALFVLNLIDDPNMHDTLAAVYASAGMYNLAVKEEEIATAASNSQNYVKRLELYRHNTVYREPKATPGFPGIFTP